MNRIFSLQGKLVLVTGASSGLGEHFAKLLAQAGAELAITARNRQKLEPLLAELEQWGCKARAYNLDVSQNDSVQACVAEVIAAQGVSDVLVNNAGQSIVKPLLEQTEQDWDQIIDTNLKGVWLMATEVARAMRQAEKPGNIINVASILGERVSGGIAPYTISKAGVKQLTKVMALELARMGIRVNALLPGYVITNLNKDFLHSAAGEKLKSRIPSRQFCTLSDLEGPMLMLASEASAGMTGSCVVVDRGHLVSGL